MVILGLVAGGGSAPLMVMVLAEVSTGSMQPTKESKSDIVGIIIVERMR